MRRTIAGIVAAACLTFAPSALATQYFHTDWLGSTPAWSSNAKTALTNQSKTLQSYWGTPWAQWDQSGFPVYLGNAQEIIVNLGAQNVPNCSGTVSADVCGYHAPWGIVIKVDYSDPVDDQLVLSHEVMETLVDPQANFTINGRLVEVSDPVEQYTYLSGNGTTLSDFTTPSYWRDGSRPYDYLDVLSGGA